MKQLFICWLFLNILLVACKNDNDDEMELKAFPESLEQMTSSLRSDANMSYICTLVVMLDNAKT